jgi:hypothetical protein
MKIFVATKETQGQRKNDFCFVPENEIVIIGFECDGEEIDGECGCHRSLSGVKCLKATTTVKVIDSNVSWKKYVQIIKESFEKSFTGIKDSKIYAEDMSKNLIIEALDFNVGAIVERRGNYFIERNINA